MKEICIVGGGFYGLFIANLLQNKYKVTILDKSNGTDSATLNCQARLHSGLFYIKSLSDLSACVHNSAKFYNMFSEHIIKDFNSYYLVDKSSKVSIDTYLKESKELHIPIKKVKLDYINHNSIQGILKAKEYSIDTNSLLTGLKNSFKGTYLSWEVIKLVDDRTKITVMCTSGFYKSFDKVIVCAYGDNPKLIKSMGHEYPSLEPQVNRIITFKDNLPKDCHAVVDGYYWNTMIKDSTSKTLINFIKDSPNYWEKSLNQMRQYIPELQAEFISDNIFTKYLMKDTRLATIKQYGNLYAVFAGKLTNVFNLIKTIEAI